MHTLKRKRKGTDDVDGDEDDDYDDDLALLPMYSLCKKLENLHRLKYFWFFRIIKAYIGTLVKFSVDRKNQLDVTFCIFYFSSNSCSTCFGQPCAHHQELTTA